MSLEETITVTHISLFKSNGPVSGTFSLNYQLCPINQQLLPNFTSNTYFAQETLAACVHS